MTCHSLIKIYSTPNWPYSGQAAKTEQERKPVEVYYSEGEGRLVSVSAPPGCDQPPMAQYLTSKLVADTLDN